VDEHNLQIAGSSTYHVDYQGRSLLVLFLNGNQSKIIGYTVNDLLYWFLSSWHCSLCLGSP